MWPSRPRLGIKRPQARAPVPHQNPHRGFSTVPQAPFILPGTWGPTQVMISGIGMTTKDLRRFYIVTSRCWGLVARRFRAVSRGVLPGDARRFRGGVLLEVLSTAAASIRPARFLLCFFTNSSNSARRLWSSARSRLSPVSLTRSVLCDRPTRPDSSLIFSDTPLSPSGSSYALSRARR
jgi:hypothetical protein